MRWRWWGRRGMRRRWRGGSCEGGGGGGEDHVKEEEEVEEKVKGKGMGRRRFAGERNTMVTLVDKRK
jgi:hypothetical protein